MFIQMLLEIKLKSEQPMGIEFWLHYSNLSENEINGEQFHPLHIQQS